MWKDYCFACMDLTVFGMGSVLVWMFAVSSVCAGHYPIDRGRAGSWPACTPGKVERVVGTQHQYLPLESEMPVVAVLDPGAHAGGALPPKSAHPEKGSSYVCAPPNNGALPVWWALASSGMPLPWLWYTIP